MTENTRGSAAAAVAEVHRPLSDHPRYLDRDGCLFFVLSEETTHRLQLPVSQQYHWSTINDPNTKVPAAYTPLKPVHDGKLRLHKRGLGAPSASPTFAGAKIVDDHDAFATIPSSCALNLLLRPLIKMSAVYSLNSAIASFLSTQSDTTQEDCNALARSLLYCANVSPVPMQGAFSYTVACQSQVVQFRAPDSQLDIEVLQRARLVHGPLVAETTYHGQIGQDRPLLVYQMNKLPGITYMEYQLARDIPRNLSEEQFEKQKGLVEDFARFFAASWQKPQAADTLTLRQTLENDLRLLAETLPPRFSQDTLRLIDALDSNLEDLPMVLSHGDLCEMNFLVDESSGRLSGVIDWAVAQVLPFGLSLWGLENILGYMDAQGWHYYNGHAELRASFWKVLHSSVNEDAATKQSSIDLARNLGILLRYGFGWDKDMQRSVVQDGDSRLRYLDAFFP